MKILLLDIETAPSLAYIWGLFKENIPLQRLVNSGYVLCWSAKWLGEEEIYFDSLYNSTPRRMLKKIHKLLEETDVVIHYNGQSFDIPTLNKEFLLYGMPPPASYQQIDLLRVVRKQFRFQSNKLEYVAKALDIGQKVKHPGFELWVQCMNKEPEAWEMMERYNKQDTNLLEALYLRLLPWITNHPNHGLYADEMICPNCGGEELVRRGFSYTQAGKYQRYQCSTCHTWSRDRKGVQEGSYGHA